MEEGPEDKMLPRQSSGIHCGRGSLCQKVVGFKYTSFVSVCLKLVINLALF